MYRFRLIRTGRGMAWVAVVAVFSLSGLSLLLTFTDQHLPMAEFGARIGLQAAALAMQLPLVFIAVQLAKRRTPGSPIPLWFIYLAGVLGGAIGVAVVNAGETLLQLSELTPWRQELVSVFLIGPLWVALLGKSIEAWVTYTENRKRMVGEALRAEMMRMQETGAIEVMHARLTESLGDSLETQTRPLVDRLRQLDSATESSQLTRFAADLRHTAQRDVRPLSRQLWDGALPLALPAAPGKFFRLLVGTQPFAPGLVTMIYLAGQLGMAAGATNGGAAVVEACVVSVLLWATLRLANLALRRWPRQHGRLYVLWWVGIEVASVAGIVRENPHLGGFSLALNAFATVALSSGLLLSTSAISLFRTMAAEELQRLREDLDAEWLHRTASIYQLAAISRDFASRLHGEVQAGLLACATALDQAVAAQDAAAVRTALDRVQALLDEPLATGRKRLPLPAELRDCCAKWEGICRIELDLDPRLADTDRASAEQIARVVEEAVTNGFRHGGADRIKVELRLVAPHSVEVQVTDNGSGVQSARAGLGHSFIEFAAGGDWSIENSPGGTVFRANLPVLEVVPG